MVEKGNDLHLSDAKLLEKIEELTLYSIEQAKRANKQEAVNQQLQAKVAQLEEMLKRLMEKK